MRTLTSALFAGMILVLAGCIKTDNPTVDCSTPTAAAPPDEVSTLQAYITTKGIIATQDKRGFFYNIDSSSATASSGYPTRCSYLTVAYIGKLSSGTTFDSAGVATPVSFSLSNTIIGWQEAIPKMKINSSMNLYLPPSLAYGATANGPIPANSILVFNIKLLGFN